MVERSNTPEIRHARIATALLLNPASAARGKSGLSDLADIEIIVFLTLVSEACIKFDAKCRKLAEGAGQIAIERERERQDASDLSIKAAGSAAYDDELLRLKGQKRPERIVLTMTAASLLSKAGYQRRGEHYAKLDAALDNLQNGFYGGNTRYPPVLFAWRRLPSGKLRLWVNGYWTEKLKSYGAVGLPPPIPKRAGTVTLPLFLCLIGWSIVKYSGAESVAEGFIKLDTLFKRIGLSPRYPAEGVRALERALDCINAHSERRIWPIAGMEFSKDGKRVRFYRVELKPETPRRKIKQRQRLRLEAMA